MKKKALLLMLTIAMCLMMTGCININVGGNYEENEGYESGGATLSDGISEIDIEWVSGKINVIYDDVSQISFSEESEGKLDSDEIMCYKVDGAKLKIKFVKRTKLVNFDGPEKNLTVTLPQDMVFEKLDIDAVSSEIHIEHSSLIKDISVDTVSGNVYAYLYGGSGDVSVDSVSGNIELNVLDEGFTAEFDTVSGSFSSDFEVAKTEDEFVYGDGNKEYKADTVSGNFRVNKLGGNV